MLILRKCCEKCFKDIYIRRFICSNGTLGECSYCGSKHIYISDIEVVGELIKKGLLRGYQLLEYDYDFQGHSDFDFIYTEFYTAKHRLYEEEIFAKSNYESLLDDLRSLIFHYWLYCIGPSA
jgi:hypothetical protein